MTTLMRVYFDARMIDHPGIGRYIRCLVPFIMEDKLIDFCLLGDRNKIKKFLGVEKNIIDFNFPIYSIQEQIGFAKLKNIIGNDILHIPHYNVPALARFNLVATIHDLIHILYPEGASDRLAPFYMKFMIEKILKSAKGVICVSQATKNEIEKRLPRLLGARNGGAVLEVIYEGVDKVFAKIDDLEYLKSVKEKYNLPDKFILYVGSIRRHKNIMALLDVFNYLRKKNADVSFVMVGRHSQDIDIKRDGIIYLGELESDRELAAIYNLASCLFNLSLHEGFGLTILEAQKCGLPVVCSDIPVHREIGGEGILHVNPSYIDQIYENLYNVLFNTRIKESLVLKGLENVRRFDWQLTAENTIKLYRKVYNEGSNSPRLVNRNAGRRENT